MESKLQKLIDCITHPSCIYVYITYRIVRIIDGIHDRRICGYDLTRRRDTNIEGGNHYAPTCYWNLDEIFKTAKFTEEDSFVDVGCGKGRVLAWWLGKGLPGKCTGIELDPFVAGVAKKWLKNYPEERVRLIEGNALEQDYSGYTKIYIFRPFAKEFLIKFLERIEAQLTHPVQLYYMSDQFSREVLWNRPGWKGIRRRRIHKKYGLCMYWTPQYYSIWKYDPQQNIS